MTAESHTTRNCTARTVSHYLTLCSSSATDRLSCVLEAAGTSCSGGDGGSWEGWSKVRKPLERKPLTRGCLGGNLSGEDGRQPPADNFTTPPAPPKRNTRRRVWAKPSDPRTPLTPSWQGGRRFPMARPVTSPDRAPWQTPASSI